MSRWCCEFDACPSKEARFLAPGACANGLPIFSCELSYNAIRSFASFLHIHLLFAGNCQHVRLEAGFQISPQEWRASVHRISCHPCDRKACLKQPVKHPPRQFRFRRKGQLFWHVRFWHVRFSAPHWTDEAAAWKIYFSIQQAVPTQAGVGQEHPHLAVFDLPSHATVLSL